MKTGTELSRDIVEDVLSHEVVGLLTGILLTEKLDTFSVAINDYVPLYGSDRAIQGMRYNL